MKKLLVCAIVAAMSFSAQAAENIRFASSATYPPFESLDANNNIVGFDIDLAKALCQEMKANCTFSNQAFDSLITALKFKRYDAVISGMDITPSGRSRWRLLSPTTPTRRSSSPKRGNITAWPT